MLYRLPVLALLSLTLFIPLLPNHASAETLVIAQLSDRPKKDFKQLRPMVRHVAEQLRSVGVTDAEVKLFSNLKDLIEAVKSGEVDWVTETPYSASVLVAEAGAIPLVTKWKSGQRHYQSLIYTHKDSQLQSLDQLTGKLIAFEHSNSFSSYYLPRLILEQQGMQTNEVKSAKQDGDPNAVNFLFSRNEKNNLLWVHKQLVDAGALNDGDWNNPKRVPPGLKSELRIIYRSEPYPRALELVSPELNPAIAESLKTLLLNMTVESDGDLLARYEKTTGFAPLPDNLPQLLNEIYSTSRSWAE